MINSDKQHTRWIHCLYIVPGLIFCILSKLFPLVLVFFKNSCLLLASIFYWSVAKNCLFTCLFWQNHWVYSSGQIRTLGVEIVNLFSEWAENDPSDKVNYSTWRVMESIIHKTTRSHTKVMRSDIMCEFLDLLVRKLKTYGRHILLPGHKLQQIKSVITTWTAMSVLSLWNLQKITHA